MKELVVLSLFDGMSCGRVALERAGVAIYKYYASEIDEHAIKVSQSNWADIARMGDVLGWRMWNIDWSTVDLLLAGSPCQGFSYAGKQLAFDDEKSKLFFVFVDILEHIRSVNPKVKFLLENVKMKNLYTDTISATLNTLPRRINSKVFSAQNRERDYWFNWDCGDTPIPRETVIMDIIEGRPNKLKVMDNIPNMRLYDDVSNQEMKLTKDLQMSPKFIGGVSKGIRIKDGKFLSRNFMYGYRVYDVCGKATTLTASPKGGVGGHTGLYGFEQEGCVFARCLSPIECERLQTLPDNYTKDATNSQRYKMIGNGWTVDVIAHILLGIKGEINDTRN